MLVMDDKWKQYRRQNIQDEIKRDKDFKSSMAEFPCSFNLGSANYSDLDPVNRPEYYNWPTPFVSKNNWQRLKQDLSEENDDEEFEDVIWKKNFLTRVYFELDDIAEATRLNEEILSETRDTNLTALANSAFLYFLNEEIAESLRVVHSLKLLTESDAFLDLKLHAGIEQGYAHRKIGGGQNLLCAIKLLTPASERFPQNEKVRFLLAMTYRRASDLMMYVENPTKIDSRDLAFKAVHRLFHLMTTAKDPSIKAAAFTEMAYLKKTNDSKPEFQLIKPDVWGTYIGGDEWTDLCDKALKICESKTVRVLKMVGQMLKSLPKRRKMAIESLKRSIDIKPSSRAYHHLGLVYINEAVSLEKKKTSRAFYGHQFGPHKNRCYLPKKISSLEDRLQLLIKVPKEKLIKIPENNPYLSAAEENLRKAVEISRDTNTSAQYDYAFFLVRQRKFTEAKRICKALEKNYLCSDYSTERRLHLVSAYNLFGMCFALEAEQEANDETKICLLDRSEEMLMKAVRVSSQIATSVPELPNCVTELWNAFTDLKSKYTFNASAESQKKLIKLCELISDYRFLPKLDETLSLLKENNLDKECLETFLKRSLEDNDLDGANFMLDLIYLHQETCNKPTFKNSKVVQCIRFEQAKQALEWSLNNKNSPPDIIWKQIFTGEYGVSHREPFDVLLVGDDEEFSATEEGIWSDLSSECLKGFLTDVCGLTTNRVNDVITPGKPALQQEISAICAANVVVFFIDRRHLHSITGDIRAELDIETATAQLGRLDVTSQEITVEVPDAAHGGQFLDPGERISPENTNARHSDVETKPNPDKAVCSERFQYLLTCAMESMLRDQTPKHVLMAVQHEADKELIPRLASGKPVLVISEKDAYTLSSTAQGERNRQIGVMINIFKHIVRKEK